MTILALVIGVLAVVLAFVAGSRWERATNVVDAAPVDPRVAELLADACSTSCTRCDAERRRR